MPPILEVEHLSVSYNGATALIDVSFAVNPGCRVAVVGPNGAGKSTLFRAIVGLTPHQHGTVRMHGLAGRAEVAYVTQRSKVDWSFPVTVFDVVMMGRIGKIGPVRWYGARDREIVLQAIERVGMEDYTYRQIGELSGGQQQRVFIARALAQEAQLLLLDEPFSGVDLPSQESILAILDDLHGHGITMLVSTHDLALASDRFDLMALLNHRLISYGPADQVINQQTLMEAYGGQAVWRGEDYAMVVGDIRCCGGDVDHHD